MPSVLLHGPAGQNILSGSNFSGGRPWPQGGLQLRLHIQASGFAYVSLSGSMTVNSGGYAQSGGVSGIMDGMLMGPGDSYFLPKVGLGASGNPQVFVACDATASGQARMYYEGW